MNQEDNRKVSYPWKSFFIFFGFYLLTLALYYPALVEQASVYIEILGDNFLYTPSQFALTSLLQPLLIGIIAIYFGHRYVEKVHMRSLLHESIQKIEPISTGKLYTLKDSVPFIVMAAAFVALLHLSFDVVFQNWLPEVFQPQFSIPTIAQAVSNLFYSGFGQEILLRWGVMTSVIYVLSSQGKNLTTTNYYIGIVFTAILYAFSQYNALLGTAGLSFVLLLRILLLSGLPGILYGWLYKTFHFEAAVLSHVLANGIIILGNVFIVEMSAI